MLVLIRLNKLSDQTIKFWSLTSKEELGTLDQPTDNLLSLVISAKLKKFGKMGNSNNSR
jgi:hypothetical protein